MNETTVRCGILDTFFSSGEQNLLTLTTKLFKCILLVHGQLRLVTWFVATFLLFPYSTKLLIAC